MLGEFARRHIGPNSRQVEAMLAQVGYNSLEKLVDTAVPEVIRTNAGLDLPEPLSEKDALAAVGAIARKNTVHKSFLGLGYYDTVTPSVIRRNILENPGWYTQYTPYQAEISQGRLTSLLNFQTMVMDLTGLDVANASVLDEATGASEAMVVCDSVKNRKGERLFYIDAQCFPQTTAVVQTRAEARGIKTKVGSLADCPRDGSVFGVLVQYPDARGSIQDHRDLIDAVHAGDGLVVMAADILGLVLLTPPGELGADFAVGSTQRFGVPMGFGGPHAGYLAAKGEYTRKLPGRMVGVSKDSEGRPAVRLSLQTREQHIRREKAMSNICTSQVLLANMAAMYAVYHGPDGLLKIATDVHEKACCLAACLKNAGLELGSEHFFDTLIVRVKDAQKVLKKGHENKLNFLFVSETEVGVSLDETTDWQDVEVVFECLTLGNKGFQKACSGSAIPDKLQRKSPFLQHEVFNSFHSETEMMRYIRRLESKDLSLTNSMIPLGSCTMKLNAASELYPISFPEFSGLHPYAPADQWQGYQELIDELEALLCAVTGFDAFSLQPNSGAQGEYAGLLAIRKFHLSRGESQRTICLIPSSAHGTNPASAVMAGMKVVVVKCDENGNIDLAHLNEKIAKHKDQLAALMVTYPSTHGVFEEAIVDICDAVHAGGGQVYMDGANMNAQIGLCLPGKFGPDVCHLNLHKTFCIPHGGGGPGVGPIGVRSHLRDFLPNHPVVDMAVKDGMGPISAAPFGSASILPISWMYIRMMGSEALTKASKVAILNANYIAKRLEDSYPILYRGAAGLVAHECIIDLRPIQKSSGVTVEDVAKRLMDYGFHAPTMAWPVAGTLMIEPTESESQGELDRFCDAMVSIRKEIAEIEADTGDKDSNLLKNAPHTTSMLASDKWSYPYSRERAAFPLDYLRESKFWPSVARVDNAFGDRNFVCSCAPVEAYE